MVNLQEPCVLYIGRAYRYSPDIAFYIYFFSTNISTENFEQAAHTQFFSSKFRLFHNANFSVPILLTFYIQVCWNLNVKLLCQKISSWGKPSVLESFIEVQYLTKMSFYLLDFRYIRKWENLCGAYSMNVRRKSRRHGQKCLSVIIIFNYFCQENALNMTQLCK
jgi:hypothetical protein